MNNILEKIISDKKDSIEKYKNSLSIEDLKKNISKYEDYFDDNLHMEIQYYMATNMLCWINPIRSATNTSENDAVWIAYPNVGDTINKCIEEEYLTIPTILNFDKHEGMLTWCGQDRSCFNNEYDSCSACLYRELLT